MGHETLFDGKLAKHACDRCGFNFDTKKALGSHQAVKGRCRKADEMNIAESVRLNRTRKDSSTRRGKSEKKVEPVEVYTCENQMATPCGDFIYLGSKVDHTTSATPEIKRRIAMAMTTFGSLNSIWKTKALTNKTKAALYRGLILSIMLYNAEVWPIKKQDFKSLRGAHFKMMRRMVVTEVENEHIKTGALHHLFGLPTIEDIITQKRMRWVGHALRRNERDRSRQAVLAALEEQQSLWTKLVIEDCKRLKIDFSSLDETAQDRNHFRTITFMCRSPAME